MTGSMLGVYAQRCRKPYGALWVALGCVALLWVPRVRAQQGDAATRVAVLQVAPGVDMLTVDGVNLAVQSGRASFPPPPQALHTYPGFTSGHWEGDTLVTETTHLKDCFLERNGTPVSNQETVRLFWTRHDNELMVLGIVRDPVYLEASWPIAQTFRLVLPGNADIVPEYCEGAEVVEGLSDGYHSATVLPDQLSTAQRYMQAHYDIPLEASEGGAQTMYPEFARHLASVYRTPTRYCTQYCCSGRNVAQFCKNSNN